MSAFRPRRLTSAVLLSGLVLSCGGNEGQVENLESSLRSNLRTFRKVIDLYKADRGRYPESLDALVREGYLRFIPHDPITRRADTWILVFKDPAQTAVPGGGRKEAERPGIYDVRSGAPGLSSHGVPYADF